MDEILYLSSQDTRELVGYDDVLGAGDVDPRLYHTVDRTIVSDWNVVSNSEDVRKLLADGSLDRSAIWADLAEIVSGGRPGRRSPRERTFVRASGLVSQDMAVAYHAYRQARERGLGTRLVVGALQGRRRVSCSGSSGRPGRRAGRPAGSRRAAPPP